VFIYRGAQAAARGGISSWCSGRCRGAAMLYQEEKNNSADVQQKSVNFTRV
jgi:hypothetical protein